jgi:dienelactone hydrolase
MARPGRPRAALLLIALAVAAAGSARAAKVAPAAPAPAPAGIQSPPKASCAARPTGPYAVPRSFTKDTVTVECSDGYRMTGDLIKRGRLRGAAPGVIYLHEDGKDRHAWHAQSVFTAARQMISLALDLRGYGENPGAVGNPAKTASAFTDADYRLMLEDVRDAVAFLAIKPEVEGGKLAIVGADMGANLALLAAGAPWGEAVRVVVAISPSLDWKGLSVRDAIARIPKSTHVYLAAAKDDPASWEACQVIMGLLKGPKDFFQADTGGHGARVFQGRSFHQIPTWLASNLVEPAAPGAGPKGPPARRLPQPARPAR